MDGTATAELSAEIAIGVYAETVDEAQLTVQITDLWVTHKETKASARKTREELKVLRCQLAERLYALKIILVPSNLHCHLIPMFSVKTSRVRVVDEPSAPGIS